MTNQPDALTISGPGEGMVSVVIPAFNSEKTLEACLGAAFFSDYPRYEVIVVNDGSTDRTGSIAAKLPCQVINLARNMGGGAARNRGAQAARGDILFFLDADITIERDTLSKVVRSFAERPEISALICSYQKNTPPTDFCSTYKNLVHHFTHQTGREDAATFCGGFGAIYRKCFLHVGGFDENCRRIADIEFGYRLYQKGHKIFLNKQIQTTHLKVYTPGELVRSDLFRRAIPWTRIMLDKRIYRNDLNTRYENVASGVVSLLMLVTLPMIPFRPPLAILFLLLLSLLTLLNWRFYRFVYDEKGLWFSSRAVAMNWLGYLYSGLGVAIGMASYFLAPIRARRAKP